MVFLYPPDQRLLEGTIIYAWGKQCTIPERSFQMAVDTGKSDACREQGRSGSFLWEVGTGLSACLLMKPYVWISWPIRLVSFLENNKKWKNQISESKKKEIQEQLKGTWAQVKRLKRKSNSTSCQSITESVNEVHSVQFEHVSKGEMLKFMLVMHCPRSLTSIKFVKFWCIKRVCQMIKTWFW